ncbi:MAG: hypothetical protein QG650_816 [Patescibacteria group bacterium]|nr:hypothetical protein [Patescibacteria group bacterium]
MKTGYIKKSALSALAFFGTLGMLSVGYSAYSSLSSVTAGQTLTTGLWTQIKDNFTDHETRISSLSSQISALSASQGMAKAWVNFDGTAAACPGGNCTIRSSYNVSGVTRLTNGAYTVTFAAPMANANYVVIGDTKADPNQGYALSQIRLHSYSPTGTSSYANVAPTTSSFTFGTMVQGYTNGTDVQYANIVVFN